MGSVESAPEFVFQEAFPEDILIHILSFLPAKDLIKNCTRVSKQWNNIIESNNFWKKKCIDSCIAIPAMEVVSSLKEKGLSKYFYRNIYLYQPYGRNLVKNPSGEDGTKSWDDTSDHMQGWAIENPPQGSDSKFFSNNEFCFATTYWRCKKYQIIDLVENGHIPEILDAFQPPIKIEEWHAARFDCGCKYTLAIKLLDAENSVLDKFDYDVEHLQWAGKAWNKVEHTFENYGPGLRKIYFSHSGQDTQFWQGHFGSKMADASVIVNFDLTKPDKSH